LDLKLFLKLLFTALNNGTFCHKRNL